MAHQKKSSAKRQEARKASWARGERRKDTRRKEQDARHQANVANPASAPWVTARIDRLARRAKARQEAA